jgi:hypothetical protein
MHATDKIRSITSAARAKTNEARLDKVQSDRDTLRTENEMLRERVRDAEEDRGRWIAIMDRLAASVPEMANGATKPKRHRVRRVLFLGAAAGSAYVLGAKAGRERYERIRSWWHDLGRTTRDVASEIEDEATRATA